jgi:hypothetical protein
MSLRAILRVITTLILCAIVPTAFLAQSSESQSVLSGVWIPEKQNKVMPNYKLSITAAVDLVLITQEFEFEKRDISNRLKLFPDGRGERNLVTFAGADEPSEVTSRITWSKGKLVRKYVLCDNTQLAAERVQICNEFIETYRMSPDGRELTVHSSMRNGNRLSSSRRKFRKEL